MANSKQSIKRARQNADRYKLKHSQRSQARTAVKAVRNAIAENNKESAAELLKTAQKVLEDAGKEDEAFYMEQMVDWLRSGKPLPTSEEQITRALGV